MINIKKVTFVAAAVFGASIAAFAQEEAETEARRPGNVISAAVEQFDLTDEQVEQIREIRSERSPRGQSREEAQAWRDEQISKVRAVLTDEQRAQIDEASEAASRMRAFAGAAALGLADSPGRNRGAWGRGGSAPGRGGTFRGRGGSRGGPGFGRGGRGRGGSGFRDRGRARDRGGRSGQRGKPSRGRDRDRR